MICGNTSDFIDHPLPKNFVSAHGASHHVWAPDPPPSKSGAGLSCFCRGLLGCTNLESQYSVWFYTGEWRPFLNNLYWEFVSEYCLLKYVSYHSICKHNPWNGYTMLFPALSNFSANSNCEQSWLKRWIKVASDGFTQRPNRPWPRSPRRSFLWRLNKFAKLRRGITSQFTFKWAKMQTSRLISAH